MPKLKDNYLKDSNFNPKNSKFDKEQAKSKQWNNLTIQKDKR